LISNEGNSETEPYIVAHNLLLAHAKTFYIYKKKYQSKQNGIIGISLNTDWLEPLTNSLEDIEASERGLQFDFGWFADPICKDYPFIMKKKIGERLPKFTEDEKMLLKGSYDFLGLNHYTSRYVKNGNNTNLNYKDFYQDRDITTLVEKDGKAIGLCGDLDWLYVVPWGLRKLLNWIKLNYDNPPIYITENGVAIPNESKLPLQEALNDTFRINYLNDYISEMKKAINIDGINIKGYFVWTLMDNFEWAEGYAKRFGLYYVDYKNNLTRYPKNSAIWFKKFIQEH
jgi:beta-glucosidase